MRASTLPIGFVTLWVSLTPVPALAAERVLTLPQCLDIAAASSPLVGVERERLAQAEADYLAARAVWFPRLTGSAFLQGLNGDRLGVMLPGSPPPSLYAREAFAGIRARQTVFDGLRMFAGPAAASQGVAAGRLGLETAGADAVFLTVQGFVRLLEAQGLVTVAGQALERQRAFEEQIVAQLQAGRGSRLDQLKAKAQRLDAERGEVAARETLQLAQALLKRALGLESPGPVRAAGELSADLPQPPAEAALLERARELNPDLRRLAAQREQSRQSVRVARASYFPELSLQGAYGYRDRDVGGGAQEWSAGVFLDWSLFEGFATLGQVGKAEARERELAQTARALELQVATELVDALTSWRTAAAAAVSTAAAEDANREAVEAAAGLHQAGRVGVLDVLTSQADLARAQANRIQALGDLALAAARLERLAGPARP
ncbi:MAG: TolC family protein [Myxococcaceae bacterium]